MASMNLDFEKALTYISKDPQWVNKLLAGSGILLAIFAIFVIPVLLLAVSGSGIVFVVSFFLCFICSFILSFALAGYVAQTANKRINYKNSLLPDWSEFGKFLKTGIKYFIGYFLYILPLLILCLVFSILLGVALGGCACMHSALANSLSFIVLTFLGALCLFGYILVMVFCPLMMANFFKDLKILSFVDYKEAFSLLRKNAGNYFILILLFIAMCIFAQIICSILVFTIIGIILIPFVYFYIYLVITELIAQFVLAAKEIEQE